MKTLTFNSKEAADVFKNCTKVRGSHEEQTDGTVILAYNYDEPALAGAEKVEASSDYREEIQECVYKAICDIERYADRRIDYVHERIDNIGQALANHSKGHLPPAKTASQMDSALKGLGWSDDYEIKKGVIYLEVGGELSSWY